MTNGADTSQNRWAVPMNRTTLGVLGAGSATLIVFGLSTSTDWSLHLLAVALTVIAAVFLKNLAPQLGLMDLPQGHKTHSGDVPVVGGLAMYIGLALCLPLTPLPGQTVIALLSACGLLVVMGALDDRSHLPVWARFAVQISAVLIMIHWGGVVLTDLGQLVSQETFTLGRWSVPMTVVATVGVINSMNMADGLDGLASTLALVTCSIVGVLAYASHPYAATLALLACSILIAFLAFNAPLPGLDPRARMFMGDAGSMMLGLLVAWLLIGLSQGAERVFPPVTALWLFALPLLDTLSVMLRRILRKRSPFAPDREHLHHVLIVAGYSPQEVVVIAACGAALFAGLGLLLLQAGVPDYWQFAIALAIFLLVNLAIQRAWRIQRWLHKS